MEIAISNLRLEGVLACHVAPKDDPSLVLKKDGQPLIVSEFKKKGCSGCKQRWDERQQKTTYPAITDPTVSAQSITTYLRHYAYSFSVQGMNRMSHRPNSTPEHLMRATGFDDHKNTLVQVLDEDKIVIFDPGEIVMIEDGARYLVIGRNDH